MTITRNGDVGGTAASEASSDERWTIASLMRRHARVTAGSLIVVLALIAATLVTSVSDPHRQPLSDSATCSQWAAATPAQKIGYSHVYIDEYGNFANTASEAAAVKTAINRACTHASYLGEADDVTIIASLRHAF
jgi:hypothetical protein